MHVFGPEAEFSGLGYRGISSQFHAAYHQTRAWRLDPLALARRRDGSRGFLRLDDAAQTAGDLTVYRRFLNDFGLKDAAEMIFSDGQYVLGGISMIWSDKASSEKPRDMAVGNDLHRFLDFTFGKMWNRTRIGRQLTLARNFGLTPREIEVSELLQLGLTNADISEQLCISLATTKSHLINLFRKLKVGTRTSALHMLLHAADEPTG
jgi:DNA-binding CsgD family transcriptional regulator